MVVTKTSRYLHRRTHTWMLPKILPLPRLWLWHKIMSTGTALMVFHCHDSSPLCTQSSLSQVKICCHPTLCIFLSRASLPDLLWSIKIIYVGGRSSGKNDFVKAGSILGLFNNPAPSPGPHLHSFTAEPGTRSSKITSRSPKNKGALCCNQS